MTSMNYECPVCLRKDASAIRIESAVPWKNTGQLENRDAADDANLVTCSNCGEFVVTDKDRVNLTSTQLRNQWQSNHVSALLREQSIRPLPRFWLQYGMTPYGPLKRTDLAPIDLNELLRRWPRTVPEKIDRTLCNLAVLSPSFGDQVSLDNNKDAAIAFATKPAEVFYTIGALIDQGFLKGPIHQAYASVVILTARGWAHFESLTRSATSPENPAFVAMWFGDESAKTLMDFAFQQGIQPAIQKAGYLSTRVDLVEHNDWIVDKILGDIRLAPFVVADFTGNRNGVYFEAGFARGLGIPVIHTCKEDNLKYAHFDTQQLNHILWNTAEELKTKLYHRIVGTIGLGPHPLPRESVKL